MFISVVIPLFNGDAFIKRSILSVFKQTRLPDELIIVDDASTDASLKIVNELIREAPHPVKIVCLENNSGGPAKPLNLGVREARGELIAILDQDDYYLPQKIEYLEKVLALRKDVRFVFSRAKAAVRHQPDYDFVQNEVERAGVTDVCSNDVVWLCSDTAISLFLNYRNPPYSFSGTMFFKQDFLRKGGFDESLRIAADYEFNCWQAFQGDIAYVSQELFFKGEHAQNLSNHVDCLFEDSTVMLKYLWLAKAKGVRLDERRGLPDKALHEWGVYAARCRENKDFRAPLALNWKAFRYFCFNPYGLKAMMRLWAEWILSCLSDIGKRWFVCSRRV